MNIPKPGTQVFFWQETTGSKQRALMACPASVVGVGEPICAICFEHAPGHARPNRRHDFTPMVDPGLTLDVIYRNGEQARRHNVQLGKLANCWTETEDLPVIHGTLSAAMLETVMNVTKRRSKKP